MSAAHNSVGGLGTLRLLLVIGLLAMALAVCIASAPGTRAEADPPEPNAGATAEENLPAPLAISNLTASFLDHDVTVTWRTNLPATTIFHYRFENERDPPDWFTLKNLTLSHEHTVATLLPHGQYRFYVESTTEDGERSVEDFEGRYYPLEQTFTEPLRILEVRASAMAVIAGRPVTIYWTTNRPCSAMVYAEGSMVQAASPVGTRHWVTLNTTRDFEGLAIQAQVEIWVSDGTWELTTSFAYKIVKLTSATNSFQMSLPLMGLAIAASAMMSYVNQRQPGPR